MTLAELIASGDTIENSVPQNSTIRINGNESVFIEVKGVFYDIEKVFYDLKLDAIIFKCKNTISKT